MRTRRLWLAIAAVATLAGCSEVETVVSDLHLTFELAVSDRFVYFADVLADDGSFAIRRTEKSGGAATAVGSIRTLSPAMNEGIVGFSGGALWTEDGVLFVARDDSERAVEFAPWDDSHRVAQITADGQRAHACLRISELPYGTSKTRLASFDPLEPPTAAVIFDPNDHRLQCAPLRAGAGRVVSGMRPHPNLWLLADTGGDQWQRLEGYAMETATRGLEGVHSGSELVFETGDQLMVKDHDGQVLRELAAPGGAVARIAGVWLARQLGEGDSSATLHCSSDLNEWVEVAVEHRIFDATADATHIYWAACPRTAVPLVENTERPCTIERRPNPCG